MKKNFELSLHNIYTFKKTNAISADYKTIHNPHFILWWAFEEVNKCLLHVLGKPRGKHILVGAELVSRLSHYRIYYI